MTSSMHNKGGASEIETSAMANCMMLLSAQAAASVVKTTPSDPACVFACKTCDRKFPSFQALGGHRASHKKTKQQTGISQSPVKPVPKSHACAVCGQEFLIGQALGGHMRRHRQPQPISSATVVAGGGVPGGSSVVTAEGSTENSEEGSDCVEKKRKEYDQDQDDVVENKRVCLDLGMRNKYGQYDVVEKKVSLESDGLNDVVEEKRVCLESDGLNDVVEDKRVCLELSLSLFPAGKFEKDDEVEGEEDDVSEEGEIVEEEKDFLKLELRQPINC